jgi:spermidine synthase
VLTVARAVSERGELTLLRRADGSLELRVNGLFAMDSSETSSERLLASASIDAATLGQVDDGADRLRVLVGGLGLGFTVAALLADARVATVLVAEIEPDLVRWHRTGLVPHPAPGGGDTVRPLLDDNRVDVVVGDVRDVVAEQPAHAVDLVLLDVDNGPGFLLHESNSAVYGQPFLTACSDLVRPGGVVAVWSASPAPALSNAMSSVFATTAVRAVPVTLNDRRTHYHLYLGHTRTARAAQTAHTADDDGVRHAG